MTFTRIAGLALAGYLYASAAWSFGVDVCFNSPQSGQQPIRNCIGVDETCRTSNLTLQKQAQCRVVATADSVSGLSGTNAIVGGRSLLHSDSTYLMAQLIGYTPWQAYQMLIYDEATDQSEYSPYDQHGAPILTDDEITSCRANWGPRMPVQCLLITPVMSGVYKFNAADGGMLLHLHARYSPNGAPPPTIGYPADYFSSEYALYEPQVNNLRAWVFGQRNDACVGGIVAKPGSGANTLPCEHRDRLLHSPQSFFAAGITPLQVPFQSNLGQLVINNDERGIVHATNQEFGKYIAPHDIRYAKVGVFLHSLGDRYSHHACTDRSYFYRLPSGDYTSNYDSVPCGQGSHFLWHAWEQGTTQSSDNLTPEHQTLRPALGDVYDQLLAYASVRRIPINPNLNKQRIVDNLIAVLQVYDAQQRLDAMVQLVEQYGALPLPGHGDVANLTPQQWIAVAQRRR